MAKSVYDDQDTNLNQLEKSFHAPSATGVGSDARPGTTDMSGFEESLKKSNGTGTPPPTAGNNLRSRADKAPKSAEDLKNDEQSAPDRFGFSAADDIKEQLGLGFTGKGSKQSKSLSKLYSSDSALKKKLAIAGAAAGAGTIAGLIAFFALLPLKIEHVVANLEKQFAAQSAQALDKQTSKLFSTYVTKHVLVGIHEGRCRSTVEPTCIGNIDGNDSPVKKLYEGWKQGKLEQKLASEHGIVFGRKGSGSNSLYMNVNAHSYNIPDSILNGGSIFDLEGTNQATKQEIRRTVTTALKQGTFYDKTVLRFKVKALLKNKYGVPSCLVACDTRDKTADWWGDKSKGGKGILYRNLMPQKYGLVLECVMDPSICSGEPDQAGSSDSERETPFQKKLRAQVVSYREKFGQDKLDDLVKRAEEVGKRGLFGAVAKSAIDSVSKKMGGGVAEELGEKATSEVALKALPIVGWVVFASGIVAFADDIGPMLQQVGYATNAATAAQTYGTFATAIDEVKSGNGDAEVLGSLSNVLSTNMSGSSEDNVDMTQAPLYDKIMEDTSTTGYASILSAVLPTASAQSKTTAYTCPGDDGATPDPVCPSEKLDRGNESATEVDRFMNQYVPQAVTGPFRALHTAASGIGNVVGSAISKIPGFDKLSEIVSGWFAPLLEWVMNGLVVNPFTDNMSGARTFDMAAAGSDVVFNKSCQVQFGCEKISDTQATAIREEYFADQQAEFEAKPLFARMFDTESPYSFVSRLAVSVPGNAIDASSAGAASTLTSPLAKLSTVFTSAFTTQKAFAADLGPDPFGVIQYGYPSIPDDADAFWQANCVNGPLAKSTAGNMNLDISDWLNTQTQDPNTGEAVATTSNPCLLIKTAVQGAGALYGIPQDTEDGTAPASTSTGSVTAGFPLKTTKAEMQKQNGSCISQGPEMCKGGHPYAAYDVMAEPGTEVVSLFDGKVVGVFLDKCPGRGVSIYSEAQGVTVSYLHMNLTDAPQMANSQVVKAGDVIGHVGPPAAGCGTPHLHIDVAARDTRPGCARENCPAANQAIFTAGDAKIGLGKSLYENFLKLP